MNNHKKYEKVWEFLTKISRPRFVGTDNHENVKKDIIQHMMSIPNTSVKQQSFPAYFKGYNPSKLILLFIGMLVIGTPFLYKKNEVILGLVFTIVAIILIPILVFLSEFIHKRRFKNPKVIMGTNLIFQSKNHQNTIEKEIPQKTMIILAHYDSITRPFSVIVNIMIFIMVGLGGIIFILQSSIYAIRKLLENDITFHWTLFLWSFIIGIALIMFIIDKPSNQTPGTLDNGSGVAALFYLALAFDQKQLQNTQIVLVATDAEEMGNLGCKAFMDKYSINYPEESTYYLVIDTIGCPKINRIVTGIKLPNYQFSPFLAELAQQELDHIKNYNSNLDSDSDLNLDPDSNFSEYPLKIYQFPPLLGIQSDHTPILVQKKPFLLIGGVSSVLHSPRDNLDAIDRTKFFTITQFIEDLIRRFDEQH